MVASGALIEGEVQREPEAVLVRQGSDSIRLRAAEVVHIAESPLAIYEYLRQRSAADGWDATQHVRLAQWAMSNDLLPQAALELLEARQLDPRERRLELLERRLDELMRLEAQPIETAPAQPPPPAVAEEPAHAEAEQEPLPRMPDDSLGYFTREIQPLLLNGCASCHRGEAGDKFPLDPSWRHGYGTAKTTEHNLRTALLAIDLGSPADSPLLSAARGPHAGVKPFAGARHDELVQRLTDWAASIGRLNAVSLPPPPTSPQYAATNQSERALADSPRVDQGIELASYEEIGQQANEEVAAPYGGAAPSPPQRGVRLTRVEPRDEFDPAIFNERFRRPEDDLPLNERPASR